MGAFPYNFSSGFGQDNARRDSALAANFVKAATEEDVASLYVPKSIGDAKGDLVGFSADNTPVKIAAAASNGSVLTSDTSQTGGVKWHKPSYTAIPAFFGTWALYGDPSFQDGAYAKTGEGVVILNGLVKRTGTSGEYIFGLPAGYRPTSRQVFMCLSSAGMVRVDVEADGELLIVPDSGSAISFLSLSGIQFLAA